LEAFLPSCRGAAAGSVFLPTANRILSSMADIIYPSRLFDRIPICIPIRLSQWKVELILASRDFVNHQH
jgi:hypothetical protein